MLCIVVVFLKRGRGSWALYEMRSYRIVEGVMRLERVRRGCDPPWRIVMKEMQCCRIVEGVTRLGRVSRRYDPPGQVVMKEVRSYRIEMV